MTAWENRDERLRRIKVLELTSKGLITHHGKELTKRPGRKAKSVPKTHTT